MTTWSHILERLFYYWLEYTKWSGQSYTEEFIFLPAELATTVENIKRLSNTDNSHLIFEFHDFMKENGASERYHKNNLKAILSFAQFMESKSISEIDNEDDILTF